MKYKQKEDLHDLFYEHLCKKIGTDRLYVTSISNHTGFVHTIKNGRYICLRRMTTGWFVYADFDQYDKLCSYFKGNRLVTSQKDFIVDAILKAAKDDDLTIETKDKPKDMADYEYDKIIVKKGTTLESFMIERDLNEHCF